MWIFCEISFWSKISTFCIVHRLGHNTLGVISKKKFNLGKVGNYSPKSKIKVLREKLKFWNYIVFRSCGIGTTRILCMYIIYRIIFPYFSIVRHTKGQLDLAKSKAELHVSINMHSFYFFMERKNEQAKSIFRQSAILLARDNSKIFCVNWAHKKRLYYSYQQFSIFKNFRYSFVRSFSFESVKKNHTFKVDVLNWKVDLHIHNTK